MSMRTGERIFGLPGLHNVGLVKRDTDGRILIMRCAMPDEPLGFQTLKNMGFKTRLTLRHHDEKKLVESMGMRAIQIPLTVLCRISPLSIKAINKIIYAPDNWPIVFGCLQGHDRTGVIGAGCRLAEDKWSLDEAVEEMQSFGFNDLWLPMMQSVKDYAAFLCIEIPVDPEALKNQSITKLEMS